VKLIWASLCFIVVWISLTSEAQSSTLNSSDPVRVRIMTTIEKIQIGGTGLRFQNIAQAFQPVAIPQMKYAQVRVLVKDGKKVWAVRLDNQDSERLLTEKYLLIQGSALRVGAQTLPGKVLLSHSGVNKIDVVGVMPLDEYVVGVLASEMPLSWPLETLKAQAVAARSYALSVMNERKNQAYHLESSILDQVFRHVVDEDENDPLIKKAVQAVKETQGVQLYAQNGRVLKAYFHSDCGGKTTAAQNVWGSTLNSGVAIDSSCPTNPKAHWKLSLSKDELARRLNVPDLSGLDLIKVPSENRIKAVRLAFNETDSKTVSANDFRQMLGFQDLRSSLFELKRIGEAFVFQGQGFGHGVGLCQWGSRALGKSGKNYNQILKHYYPLAVLR
jgi:stage II sporulation protein D